MGVPPESIRVGKCYLAEGGRIRRVTMLLPEGDVRYVSREAGTLRRFGGVESILSRDTFASQAQREVPCNWTPEGDG
jgi:putative hemolysin